MAGKNKKGKSKKGKDPESSTPETSINSVDDDTQQLLRSGAGASTDGRKSRAHEKTKKDSWWTLQRNPSSCQSLDASSSSKSPRSSAQSGRPTDPDLVSSSSPSKKGSLNLLQKLRERKSPNRSPNIECSCDAGNHKPECPKSKDLPVDPRAVGGARRKTFSTKKDKTNTKSSSSFRGAISKTFSAQKDKASTESSGSLAGAGQKTSSAKKNDGTQSSSSSDPSFAEYFASASESQQSSERSLLLDPNQGSEVRHEKTTHATRMREKFTTKRQGNRSSATESSLEEKTNDEQKCPEQRKHKMDLRRKSLKGKTPNPKQTTSKTAVSSGSSTSTKNESGGASYRLPRFLSSKSSTKPDPKGKRNLKGPSGNKNSESNTGASSIPTDSDRFEQLFRDAKARGEGASQQATGGYEPQATGGYEPQATGGYEPQATGGYKLEIQDKILIDRMDVERRGLIPSRGFIFHLPEPKLEIPFNPNTREYNFREMNIQIRQIEWNWLEERRRKSRKAEKKAKEEKDWRKKRNSAINKPDEKDRELIREAANKGQDPSKIRHDSSSPVRVRPCNCGAEQGRRTGHHYTCAQQRDLKRRFLKRKNRFG